MIMLLSSYKRYKSSWEKGQHQPLKAVQMYYYKFNLDEKFTKTIFECIFLMFISVFFFINAFVKQWMYICNTTYLKCIFGFKPVFQSVWVLPVVQFGCPRCRGLSRSAWAAGESPTAETRPPDWPVYGPAPGSTFWVCGKTTEKMDKQSSDDIFFTFKDCGLWLGPQVANKGELHQFFLISY